jgi:putative ABC transport system permease protein
MSSLRLIVASIVYHWRMNFAVACGAAAGTAVLTGALLVGDSMRGSLRHLALDRLGNIDEALVADRFFREQLADELGDCPDFRVSENGTVPFFSVPAILLPASMENPATNSPLRVNHVQLIGCDQRFWHLGEKTHRGAPIAAKGTVPFSLTRKSGQPPALPQSREIVLNRPLAEKLGLKIGDEVILRLPRPGAIPADSALGQKRDTVQSFRLTVSQIIPAEGLGRFGLRPTQHVPLNAFVSLSWLQDRLEQPGRVNAIFVHLPDGNLTKPCATASQKQCFLRPKLADLGLTVEKTPLGYINVTSDRMILAPSAEKEILKAIDNIKTGTTPIIVPTQSVGTSEVDAERQGQSVPTQSVGTRIIQPAFTYLANTIAAGKQKIPYSTITAIDFSDQPPLGPFLSTDGKPIAPLKDDQIALNSWAADELNAKVGDSIDVQFFEPESIEGQIKDRTETFRLAAIVELAGAADDRALTPKVKNMTDASTMADWDPPFPFDPKRIRPQDEQYWDQHGPTPKAFVSLAAGRKLWSSRFGQTTSIRISAHSEKVPSPDQPLVGAQRGVGGEGLSLEDVETQLSTMDPMAFGLTFQPVKQQALTAAAGTTPFNALFLAFSFFVIAAAAMLVLLLFRLGVEYRVREMGILSAVGFRRRQVRRILLAEGFAISLVGGVIGLLLGVGYAALMLLGLRTLWLAAIVTPFLRLYITSTSLAVGLASGILLAMAAIALSVRSVSQIDARRMLAGQTAKDIIPVKNSVGATAKYVGATVELSPRDGSTTSIPTTKPKLLNRITWSELILIFILAGTVLFLLFAKIGETHRPAAFFGGGSLVLVCLLGLVRIRLGSGRTGPAIAVGRGNILRMALRNAARNPGRSTLTIALMAAACFLIVSVSAFRIDVGRQTPKPASGNGGFSLVAQTDQPIYQNLNSPDGRSELGFTAEDEKHFSGATVMALRVKSGDDASCLNLYRPRQPRLLGLPRQFIDRGGFAWADVPGGLSQFLLSKNGTVSFNPWTLLHQDLGLAPDGTPRIPVILEKNTANYSLNLWQGLGENFDISDEHGDVIHLQVVALLDNSIFQGDLLLAESDLLKYFPQVTGYRFFLFETPPEDTHVIQKILERNLGDYGITVETTAERLADFMAVQNTYLSTFQSLGGLGLLLGTFGLAAVQLRNVIERRGELALLRAAGYRRRRLAGLVLLENFALLLAGLGCGILAALLSILPQLVSRNAAIPWLSLLCTLALILIVGLITGLIAAGRVLRAPLLMALREER